MPKSRVTPERWTQIEQLFHRAAECAPEHRAALLDGYCGSDAELRRQVEALLSYDENAGDSVLAAVREGLDDVGFPLTGETISHYHILDGLGGGGMGLVYRAEDIRLGRRVAVKFLPEELASEPAALERFEREARAASALDHPNICSIHEFGEHEGKPFIVMQLLEGQTLRERIGASTEHGAALPTDELLGLAIQITEGLEAAHNKGIIHRDIKPANIFVTTNGQAKILDFGVAKRTLFETASGTAPQHEHQDVGIPAKPQESVPATDYNPFLSRAGVAIGTAGYMSPEQTRGEKLDARTDLFSFGLVLYEMATGQRAFPGETAEALCEAILNRTPTTVRELNSELPSGLEQIINKALEKNREARYQTASEIRADLKGLKLDWDSGGLTTVPVMPSVSASGRARPGGSDESKRRWPLATVAFALGLMVLTGLAVWFFTAPVPAPGVRQTVQLTHFGRVASPIVTDGVRLYFAERQGGHYSLAQVSVEGGEPTPIATPFRNTMLLDISPDHSGLLVGGFAGGESEYPIWVLPTSGASPRRLGEVMGHSAAWSPDGQRIVYALGSDLYLVQPDGSGSRKLVNATGTLGNPRWSPDGHVLRFTVWGPGTPTVSLWEVSVDGRNFHRLLAGWRESPTAWLDGELAGDWTPDGKYFVFRSARAGKSSVWALREKTDALRRGSSDPLLLTTSDLDVGTMLSGQSGRRIFFVGNKEIRELARYDAQLKQFVPFLSGVASRSVSFSKDGQWVAYAAPPGFSLWRSRVDGSDRQQLTFPPMYAEKPQWSPDGKQIAFHSLIPGGMLTRIYVIPSEGGTPEAITPETYGALGPEWSPQGDSLVFARSSVGIYGQGEQLTIDRIDLKTKQLSPLPGSKGCQDSALSPNGRYVAALADDAKKLVLFDSKSQLWTELAKGAGLFGTAWSADSKYVYSQDVSVNSEQPIFRVRISDRKIERIATSSQILRPDVIRFSFVGLAPDGSPLVALVHSNSDIYALDVDFP